MEIKYTTSYSMLVILTYQIVPKCGTKNIDHNKPSTTGNGIMKIASVILKNNNNKAIITSLLPQDKNYMLRQKKKK